MKKLVLGICVFVHLSCFAADNGVNSVGTPFQGYPPVSDRATVIYPNAVRCDNGSSCTMFGFSNLEYYGSMVGVAVLFFWVGMLYNRANNNSSGF